jgi:sortase B
MDKHNRKYSLFINRLSLIVAFLCIIIGVAVIAIPVFSFLNDYIENEKVDSLYRNSEKRCNVTSNNNINKTKNVPKSLMILKMQKKQNIQNTQNIQSVNKIKSEKKYLYATDAIMAKYKGLLNINKDIIGWIKIDNTKINYPIFHANNNEYYLHRDITRKKSVYGSIFLDHRNNKNMADKNLLIYGHNMLDHSMFNNLVYFKGRSFFEKHRYIQIDNLYTENMWEIFSVYIVDANKETIAVNFKNNNEFLNYIEKCKNRSIYKRNIKLNKADRIVTLVTCSYEFQNARTIIQARLVK